MRGYRKKDAAQFARHLRQPHPERKLTLSMRNREDALRSVVRAARRAAEVEAQHGPVRVLFNDGVKVEQP